jgi:hypothetical protein
MGPGYKRHSHGTKRKDWALDFVASFSKWAFGTAATGDVDILKTAIQQAQMAYNWQPPMPNARATNSHLLRGYKTTGWTDFARQ